MAERNIVLDSLNQSWAGRMYVRGVQNIASSQISKAEQNRADAAKEKQGVGVFDKKYHVETAQKFVRDEFGNAIYRYDPKPAEQPKSTWQRFKAWAKEKLGIQEDSPASAAASAAKNHIKVEEKSGYIE